MDPVRRILGEEPVIYTVHFKSNQNLVIRAKTSSEAIQEALRILQRKFPNINFHEEDIESVIRL
jgi:hypothetical protein